MNAPLAPTPTRRQWLLLATGLCVLFGGFLGSRGLNEPDEGRYANIALAMARAGGDRWEPRMSGYAHYDKPPLIYWATAAGFRAFGMNEWAARLPSLFGALLTLTALGWAAYRLRGPTIAWWAVLIGGTSVQLWVFGRILSPDMLLTGWCTLAVAAWAEGRHRLLTASPEDPSSGAIHPSGGAWRWWFLSLFAWTLAWWTKATPALIPLAGLTLGIVLMGDRPGRRALKPFLLFPAILLLGSPWYLSMLHTYPELKSFFFGRELAHRLAGRVDGRHGSVFYYLPVCLVAWLPWWPVAVRAWWRERCPTRPSVSAEGSVAPPHWRQRPGVEGWIVFTGLIILSLTASKLPSYTLTLAPWVALLMARASANLAAVRPLGWRHPLVWPSAGFFVVALAGSATLPRRYESRLGVNSSVREVSAYLRSRGAARVDADHYWPGLEFYLGSDTVHYVVRIDGNGRGDALPPNHPLRARKRPPRIERYHERDSDPGVPPARFVDPALWPRALPPVYEVPIDTGGWWFVRFHREKKPRFDQSLVQAGPALRPVKIKRIGDFDLYQIPEFVRP